MLQELRAAHGDLPPPEEVNHDLFAQLSLPEQVTLSCRSATSPHALCCLFWVFKQQCDHSHLAAANYIVRFSSAECVFF